MNFTIFSLNVKIVSSKITKRVIKVTLLQLTEDGNTQLFQGPQSSVCNDIFVSAIFSDSNASVLYDRHMYMNKVVALQTTIA